MEHIINSLSHIVWVQIALICITGISACSTAVVLILNKRLSRKVENLQWIVKYLNRPHIREMSHDL